LVSNTNAQHTLPTEILLKHENNYGEFVTLSNLQSVLDYILHQTMAFVVIYGI